MKFTSNKKDLVEAVNKVQKAVSTKSTLPILEGIYIEAGEKLKLTGNDLELGIESYANAIIEDTGSIVINSRIFGDIIRRLPDSNITVYTKENNIVIIECENSHFEVKGISGDSYPILPEIDKINAFTIGQKIIRDMIRQTIFAVGVEEFRPILKGSLLEYKDNELTIVSIDGYRVAIRKSKANSNSRDMRVVVPAKTLNEIMKILQSDGDEEISVYCSNNQIMFDSGDFRVVSRLIEGEYMNYKNFIPDEYETKITVVTKDLLASIERAYLIIAYEKDKHYPIKLNIENDKIVIVSNSETGNVRDEINIEMTGKKIEIGFNPVFFIDALRAIDDEAINIYFTSNIGPCTIRPLEGDSYIYMILPQRI